MADREQHIQCVVDPFGDGKIGLCGNHVGFFLTIDHWYRAKMRGTRLVLCPECADVLIRLLDESH